VVGEEKVRSEDGRVRVGKEEAKERVKRNPDPERWCRINAKTKLLLSSDEVNHGVSHLACALQY
jgi:hypothetical protein